MSPGASAATPAAEIVACGLSKGRTHLFFILYGHDAADADGCVTMVTESDSEDLAVVMRQLADQVAALQRQIATIAEDTRVLREQVGSTVSPQVQTAPASKPKREGRKRGLAAVMGRIFWDRMMQAFVEEIRKQGPMTAAQLYATLDEDARDMAAAAFERIDVSLIMEKVEERVRRKNYFSKTSDGRYDAL